MTRINRNKSNKLEDFEYDQHTCPTCGHKLDINADLSINTEINAVIGNGIVALLTPNQMDLLIALKDAYPRVQSQIDLVNKLYPVDAEEPDAKIIDVMVCKIRDKIKNTGIDIESVWGKGYRIKWEETLESV